MGDVAGDHLPDGARREHVDVGVEDRVRRHARRAELGGAARGTLRVDLAEADACARLREESHQHHADVTDTLDEHAYAVE